MTKVGLLKLRRDRRAIQTGSAATAIALASVAIVIAVALGGWAMALGGETPPSYEAVRIFPESRLKTDGTFSLVARNLGTIDASITGIRIDGVDVTVLTTPGVAYPIPVKAGASITITGTAPQATLTAGQSYEVSIYTADGNVYLGLILAS